MYLCGIYMELQSNVTSENTIVVPRSIMVLLKAQKHSIIMGIYCYCSDCIINEILSTRKADAVIIKYIVMFHATYPPIDHDVYLFCTMKVNLVRH